MRLTRAIGATRILATSLSIALVSPQISFARDYASAPPSRKFVSMQTWKAIPVRVKRNLINGIIEVLVQKEKRAKHSALDLDHSHSTFVFSTFTRDLVAQGWDLLVPGAEATGTCSWTYGAKGSQGIGTPSPLEGDTPGDCQRAKEMCAKKENGCQYYDPAETENQNILDGIAKDKADADQACSYNNPSYCIPYKDYERQFNQAASSAGGGSNSAPQSNGQPQSAPNQDQAKLRGGAGGTPTEQGTLGMPFDSLRGDTNNLTEQTSEGSKAAETKSAGAHDYSDLSDAQQLDQMNKSMDGGSLANGASGSNSAVTDKKVKIDTEKGGLRYAAAQGGNDGPCAISKKIGSKYECESTIGTTKTIQTGTQVGMMGLGMGTQVMGMQAGYKAQKSGSMSGAMNASADAQKMTGMAQMGAGAGMAVAGAILYGMGSDHSGNAKTFKESLVDLKANDLENNKANMNMSNHGQNAGEHGYVTLKAGQSADRELLVGGIMGTDKNSEANFGDMNQRVSLQTVPNAAGGAAGAAFSPAAVKLAKDRREVEVEQKTKDITREVNSIGRRAQEEQDRVASQTKMAGFMTAMQGVSQMIGGYANMKAAEINKDTANKMAPPPANPTWNFPGNQGPGINPGDALAPNGGSAIAPGPSGDGSTAASDSHSTDKPTVSLGDPVGNQDPKGLANQAPGAPNFKTGDASGGGGSGGGGLGGGSTSPAQGGGDENPAPRMADGRGAPAYEGGGGAAYRGSGGGGAGDKGPDLSGMLAAFLPKQGEDGGNKNGIMDYNGGRGPAGGPDENASLLDRNINIFERVHQAYQEKQLKKRVGI